MAPIPRLRADEPLEAGQTTIFSTLNGTLSLAKPPPPPRLGPRPKTTGHADTVLGRRMIGGINERQTVELFAIARLSQSDTAELGDTEIVNGTAITDDSDSEVDEYEYLPVKRYAYSREHKLAAIDYYQTTWIKKKDNTFKRMSVRYAARKLKITRKMLRSWIANKENILAQKKGSFRSTRQYTPPKEPVMESQLNAEFEKAQEQGRKISYKWILRHAKAIYGQLHPDRVIHREGHRKTYLGFRFSNSWYQGFKRRFNISLRCSTNQA
jgi:hypothetical protein